MNEREMWRAEAEDERVEIMAAVFVEAIETGLPSGLPPLIELDELQYRALQRAMKRINQQRKKGS